MAESAERLKSELAALSAQERADLAYFLLRSLDDGEDVDAEAAWDRELARREEEVLSGKVVCKPADQVLRGLREDVQRSADERLLRLSDEAARCTKFPVRRTEETIRRARRERNRL